jgi:hypothetical protein
LVNYWRDITDDGNRAAERNVSFDSFFPPKFPRGTWGNRLYITEFLDTVERLPGLGFLYHTGISCHNTDYIKRKSGKMHGRKMG